MTFDVELDDWVEPSALSLFGSDPEPFRGQWGRAGTVRRGSTQQRSSAHTTETDQGRLWPTPAASTPNDGEAPWRWLARFVKHASSTTKATRAGVPLAVAARAPVVLSVARVGMLNTARELLSRHAQEPVPELNSEEELNPVWVEMLMGFPAGWTDV